MRVDFERIAALIPRGASLLDLGCAEGDMLQHMRRARGASGVGADIDPGNLIKCFEKGVQAVHCDIGRDLTMFANDAFDAAVLSDTLQSVRAPTRLLLSEMLRVARTAIVSFPNFGHWRMRLQLLGGRMPDNRALPHRWHSTPNVRYCTIDDFELLCAEEAITIRDSIYLSGGREIRRLPNLRAETAIYRLSRPD